MKTLADVRRRMTPGTVVDVVNHGCPRISGQRTVVKNQTRAICWRLESGKEGWTDWPKAAEIRIDGPDAVTFLSCGIDPFITITFRTGSHGGA